MKKIFSLILIVLFLSLPVSASQAVSWYCVRNKEHKQPVLGEDLKIIEKYNGYWCDKNHNDQVLDDKVVYLTFDAGYENGNVEKILDSLKKNDVKASFFILSNLILNNADLVKRMIEDGHIVANHTSKHIDISTFKSKDELKKELLTLETLYKERLNAEMPKYFRPPEGKFTEESLSWLSELGYKTIMWSFAYADWDNNKQPPHNEALEKILDNIHNGAVILLHPTSSTNAEIMNELILKLKNDGYRFGDLNELCNN
jgi:peptidoglycan-N-acetylmuramic acid deacetylase